MKPFITFVFVSLFSFLPTAHAFFGGDSDEAALLSLSEFVDDYSITAEEPLFLEPSLDRDVAMVSPVMIQEASELNGQLSVLSEIPFTYPWSTRASLTSKVLNRMGVKK